MKLSVQVARDLRSYVIVVYFEKLAELFKIVIFNMFQYSPSSFLFALQSTLWCFSSSANHYFQVSQHFNRNLGHWKNDSKYRDVAPLSFLTFVTREMLRMIFASMQAQGFSFLLIWIWAFTKASSEQLKKKKLPLLKPTMTSGHWSLTVRAEQNFDGPLTTPAMVYIGLISHFQSTDIFRF